MSSPVIDSRSFQTSSTPAFLRLLKEIFRATPLYLFVAALQGRSVSSR